MRGGEKVETDLVRVKRAHFIQLAAVHTLDPQHLL